LISSGVSPGFDGVLPVPVPQFFLGSDWLRANADEFLSSKKIEVATKLDGFKADVARNLNKTRKWRECYVSCKQERHLKDHWHRFTDIHGGSIMYPIDFPVGGLKTLI
jgi:hypothetical protein